MKLIAALRSHRSALLRATSTATGGERIVPKLCTAGMVTSSNSQSGDNKSILELLQRVADGKVSPLAAAELCSAAAEYEAVGNFAKIDTKREARTGFPEVVYAESKTSEQVAAIMNAMIDRGEDNVIASRVTPSAAGEIQALMPDRHLIYYEVPRILASKSMKGGEENEGDNEQAPTACILCAGTSDLPVAEEAAITLELADYRVTRLYDVGVAGIHRLLRNQHILRASDVAICVAGMDGALPGVVGGLTSAPVIAVPTSVGYGAAFGGLAPLLTMLNACSPGVGVVNIDNGFGAAVLAASMGRKKAAVTRNKSIDRHLPAVGSSSPASSLLGDVSPSSLRGLVAIKQEPTAMDTESSSDSPKLPSPMFQPIHTALPIGENTQERRPKNRRKRRSSGDDVVDHRRDEEDNSSDEEKQNGELEQQQEMVTISVAELEKWQQRVIFHVEDHFTNEQLKRIAEFGRVHGTIMQEAKQYVSNMEIQLQNQLEEDRTSLRAQAEEFVSKMTAENHSLCQQLKQAKQTIETLEQELAALKAEKTQWTQQKDSEKSQNHEPQQTPQQTHSPPNNQTQVQPGHHKINVSAEALPINDAPEADGHEPEKQGPIKQIEGKPASPSPHLNVDKKSAQVDKHQAQQNASSANGTQSKPVGGLEECLPPTDASKLPVDTGEVQGLARTA
ncbi:Pyridinium-3 [Phytophthora citrophthora]|uniref:phosphoribosylaminoimidazole carboxylase n=1 Tax=Phytophthora citrophthora TaxID=4793 RepID=A0AAD9GUC5_9STRA|nr:Pyridinium-3 [Phytophthora citrophthora]